MAGKWSGNKSKPLYLKWVSSPTIILDIFFSYDEKGNNEINCNLKIDNLQTNLDTWKSRDFTSDRAGTCETVLGPAMEFEQSDWYILAMKPLYRPHVSGYF